MCLKRSGMDTDHLWVYGMRNLSKLLFLELSQYGQYQPYFLFSTPPDRAPPGQFSNSNYNLTTIMNAMSQSQKTREEENPHK